MKIHFIGIGGIGTSALAQYYLSKGNIVTGSDLVSSEITDFLSKKGIKIFKGNFANNIKRGIDLVIYSPAVPKENPEYKRAKELRIELKSYPEALGDITKKYYTIAVAGSHGKSTTTAMIGLILEKAGFDPTVIVGTKLKEFGNSNFRKGRSKYMVIEACEYDGSFLHYSPKIIVVTNIDKEHLDYFKNLKNVVKAFKNFIKKLPENGWLIFNKEDSNIPSTKKSIGYSLRQKEAEKLKKILKIPGNHNVSNALASLAAARILKIKDEISFKALSDYQGSWRRFEIIKKNPYIVISDYGHHPNEIIATLKAAREKYPKKKIWCVFQPHQYQRTHYLFYDFTRVFRISPTDNIIITDIYDVAGRETKKISRKISSKKLVEKIKKDNVIYLPLENLENFIKSKIASGDVLIIMGAGDIYKLAEKF